MRALLDANAYSMPMRGHEQVYEIGAEAPRFGALGHGPSVVTGMTATPSLRS